MWGFTTLDCYTLVVHTIYSFISPVELIFMWHFENFNLHLNKDAKTQDLLNKHLIKSTLNEIANEMIKFLASEQMIQFNEENFTGEVKILIINLIFNF